MAELKEIKLKNFEDAVLALERALATAEGPPEQRRNSSLMCFAFTSEMAWKFLKTYFQERGADTIGSKDAYRTARTAGIIDEETTEKLLEMVDDRNRLVHEYNLKFADVLLPRVRDKYTPAIRSLYEGLAKNIVQ